MQEWFLHNHRRSFCAKPKSQALHKKMKVAQKQLTLAQKEKRESIKLPLNKNLEESD